MNKADAEKFLPPSFLPPSRESLFKNLPIIIILIPLSMVLVFSFFVFYCGTPGFRVDKTQFGLKIGTIHHTLNPVQINDLIIRIDGLDYHQILSLLMSSGQSPGKQGQIMIKRGKTFIKFKPETTPVSPFRFFSTAWPHLILMMVLILLGTISYLRTTNDQPVFLFLLSTSFFAAVFSATLPSYFGILYPPVISLSFFALAVCNWIAFGACLHFVFCFPADRNITKNKKWLIALFYLAAPLISIISALVLADTAGEFWGWLQRLRNVALPVMALAAFLKHCIDYRRVSSSLEKNQIKLILSAYWLSFGPYLILYAIPNMLFNNPVIPFRLVVLSSIILPGAYFIALIRYRLLDVDKMISRTVSYFLLIGILLISYSYLTVFLKRAFMGRAIFSEEIFLIYIIIVAILFEPVSRLISFSLDKIFLPGALYRYDMIPALTRQIGASIHLKDLINFLTCTIPEDFHIQKVMVLIFEDQTTRIFPYHPDFNQDTWNFTSLKSIFSSKTDYLFARPVSFDMPLKNQLNFLESCEIELIFALQGGAGLSGLLLLGKREDGRPYTRRDVRFFTTISNQAGLALENVIQYESLIESKKQIEKMFAKVVQAEKMAALGEMTTVLAHELKNPLSIIRSSAQYLTKNFNDTHTLQELLEYIIGEVDGLKAVINNMMGLARYKVPDLAVIDLYSQMTIMIDLWNRSQNHNKAVSIKLVPPAGTSSIFADFKQLQQVFLNCITNAEDAMPDGGKININIDCRIDDTIAVCISDTGSGIPEENMDHVFKKFFTTKEKGMGIGLSVCKQIICAHNGSISIKNRTNGGLNVMIHLPCKPLTTLTLSNPDLPDTKESSFA